MNQNSTSNTIFNKCRNDDDNRLLSPEKFQKFHKFAISLTSRFSKFHFALSYRPFFHRAISPSVFSHFSPLSPHSAVIIPLQVFRYLPLFPFQIHALILSPYVSHGTVFPGPSHESVINMIMPKQVMVIRRHHTRMLVIGIVSRTLQREV